LGRYREGRRHGRGPRAGGAGACRARGARARATCGRAAPRARRPRARGARQVARGRTPAGRPAPRAAGLTLLRQAELAPAAPAAVPGDDVPVAHLLEGGGGGGGAEAAAAVEDDLGVVLGDARLDVALDDALPDVHRSGRTALLPLGVLAHVDQVEALAEPTAACDLLGR